MLPLLVIGIGVAVAALWEKEPAKAAIVNTEPEKEIITKPVDEIAITVPVSPPSDDAIIVPPIPPE